MKNGYALGVLLACIIVSGCLTTKKYGEEQPLTSSQVQDIMSKTVFPQTYGLGVVPIGNGITYLGAARVHPNHRAELDLLKKHIPVVKVEGRQDKMKANALLDVGSPNSWIEVSKAMEMETRMLGINKKVMPYFGEFNAGGVSAFAGVISRLRYDQFFVENMPIYVRMAKGSLGPLSRGIVDPDIHMVVGYDCIKSFEYIQYDLSNNKIRLSATTKYQPAKDRLISKCRISRNDKFGCAVEGAIYGEPTVMVLDPAGDYMFARADYDGNISKQISVGDVVARNVETIAIPNQSASPRIGRKVFERYLVTVCPIEGFVYFERPTDEGDFDYDIPFFEVKKPTKGKSIRDVR